MSSQPHSRDGSTLIQIDTVEDWERLKSNFTDAIERALDAQLGPTASLAVRDALRQHLFNWRDKTFEIAKGNVRVNGVEAGAASGEGDMEPFDEVLNHQVYALEEERMAWEKTISEYRRHSPNDIRRLTEGLFDHEQAIEYRGSIGPSVTEDLDVNSETTLPNLAEITATHARALSQNRSVLEVAPYVAERATRAPRVAEELMQLL